MRIEQSITINPRTAARFLQHKPWGCKSCTPHVSPERIVIFVCGLHRLVGKPKPISCGALGVVKRNFDGYTYVFDVKQLDWTDLNTAVCRGE